jgi:hypothetical protein
MNTYYAALWSAPSSSDERDTDERDLLQTPEQALIPSFAGEREGRRIAE